MPLDPLVTAALVSGAASAATSLFNAASTQKTNKDQMALAEQQYKWAVEQWNRENEYNKPINQMARLKEAGINPNMVFGSLSGNVAGSAPSPNMPNLQVPMLDSAAIGGSAGKIALARYNAKAMRLAQDQQELQNKQIQQNLDLLSSQINKTDAETQSIRLTNAENQVTLPYRTGKAAYDYYQSSEQFKQAVYQSLYDKRTLNQRVLSSKLQNAKTRNEIAAVQAGVMLTHSQRNLTDRQAAQFVESTRGLRNDNDFRLWCQNFQRNTGINPSQGNVAANAAAAVIASKLQSGEITRQQADAWVVTAVQSGVANSNNLYNIIGSLLNGAYNAGQLER